MPEYPLQVGNADADRHDESYEVTLAKVPKSVRGVWLDLGDGTAARLDEVRRISGDDVLFGIRDPAGVSDHARLVTSARRR
jgi:hypothetical protein